MASTKGGGIDSSESATLTITKSVFSNDVTSDGGGLSVAGSASVTISGSTFTSDSASSDGGGIDNSASVTLTLTVTGCIFSNDTSDLGGGLYNHNTAGNVSIGSSTFTNNSATTGSGGGIYSDAAASASMTISGSIFTGNNAANNGGGISNANGIMIVTNCTISDNTATVSGGGIGNSATLSVTGSNIFSNAAGSATLGNGGGIRNSGTLTVGNSTFTNNTSANNGGGIFNTSPNGNVTITNSVIDQNIAAQFGGGLLVDAGDVTITGSTISRNSAFQSGGIEVEDGGAVTLINSTVSGNQATSSTDTTALAAGGLAAYDGLTASSSITLVQVTLSGNTAASSWQDAKDLYLDPAGAAANLTNTILGSNSPNNPNVAAGSGEITSLGGNVVFDGSASARLTGAHDLNNTDSQLGPLQNNGGLTFTQALSGASPARGNGLLSADSVTTDQPRRPAHPALDSGAYQLDIGSVTATSGGGQTTAVNTPFSLPLRVTVTDAVFGIPLTNIPVIFAAPGSGAGVIFPGGDNTATTNAQGVATIGLTADNLTGSYAVTAGVTGINGSVTFTLTNTGPAPTSTITFPTAGGNVTTSSWTGMITGAANDYPGGAGVASVGVSIFDGSHYWNGTAFASATPVFNAATFSAGAWSLPFAVANLPEGRPCIDGQPRRRYCRQRRGPRPHRDIHSSRYQRPDLDDHVPNSRWLLHHLYLDRRHYRRSQRQPWRCRRRPRWGQHL